MDKRDKRILLYIAFGVVLYAALMHLDIVLGFIRGVIRLFLPVIAGLVIAFILSVPMRWFEKMIIRLTAGFKRKPGDKAVSCLSLLLTFAVLGLIVTLVCTVTIPEITKSFRSIAVTVEQNRDEWMQWIEQHGINNELIGSILKDIDTESLINKLNGGGTRLISSLLSASMSIASGIATAGMGLIIAVYVLLDRKSLGIKCRRLLYAYISRKNADRLCRIAAICNDIFSKFLSGQCMEACLLALLIFIAFSLFRLPYAALIGILTGVCAFIPYVGAFLSCSVGALLILMIDPVKAVTAVIVYLAVQQIDNHFVYPNVVGGSVGMSPLLTLIAALIGGNLFGLAGMIFFIPITAVACSLLWDNADKRTDKEEMPENGSAGTDKASGKGEDIS